MKIKIEDLLSMSETLNILENNPDITQKQLEAIKNMKNIIKFFQSQPKTADNFCIIPLTEYVYHHAKEGRWFVGNHHKAIYGEKLNRKEPLIADQPISECFIVPVV